MPFTRFRASPTVKRDDSPSALTVNSTMRMLGRDGSSPLFMRATIASTSGEANAGAPSERRTKAARIVDMGPPFIGRAHRRKRL
jgi:hypothetical protein